MLEMLIYIDNVCFLLCIPYILDGGTVLGAVRHGKEHIVLGRTDGISSSELKAKIMAKTAK